MLLAMASRKPLVQLSWLLWLSWVFRCTGVCAAIPSHTLAGATGSLPGISQILPGNGNNPSIRNAPSTLLKGTTTGANPGGKDLRGRTHRVDNPVHSSATDKLSAGIGANDTLTSAPITAFGFLPSKAASLPTALTVPAATTVSSSKSGAPLLATALPTAPPIPLKFAISPNPAGISPQSVPVTHTPTSVTAPSPNSPAAPSAQPSSTSSTTAQSPASTPPALGLKSQVSTPSFHAVNPSADVVLDSTLGQTGQPGIAINGNGANSYAIDASLGLTAGTNVFFSFSQFSLAPNEIATFMGPNCIQNIIARVTGGSPSTIYGTIDLSIPKANFYLMNPAGIMFASSASINVPGSFVVTTADYLKLADGNRFTAFSGPADASLTTGAISAFGFLPGKPTPPAPISFTGTPSSSQLATLQGKNFIVVGGNQTVDGFTLFAPAAQLTLVSVAGPGEVPAVPSVLRATPLSTLPTLGTINIQDFADVTVQSQSAAAGNLEIDAATVNILSNAIVDASALQATGSPAPGASILVRCQSLLVNSATIQAENFGPGPGATIDLQAQTVNLLNGSQVSTITSGQGTSGNLIVTSGSFTINGSFIGTSTNGSGAAGNITVTANTLAIVGVPGFQASGILAESGFLGLGGQIFTGRSGDIDVTAEQLTLTGGGEISATTFGPGQGGNVLVTANNISISGSSTYTLAPTTYVYQSGILAGSELPGSDGASVVLRN